MAKGQVFSSMRQAPRHGDMYMAVGDKLLRWDADAAGAPKVTGPFSSSVPAEPGYYWAKDARHGMWHLVELMVDGAGLSVLEFGARDGEVVDTDWYSDWGLRIEAPED